MVFRVSDTSFSMYYHNIPQCRPFKGGAFNIRGGDYKVWCSGYQILHSQCILTIYRNAVHSSGGRSILGQGITRFGVQGIRYFILNILSQYTAMPSIQGGGRSILGEGITRFGVQGMQILHSQCIITIYRNAVHSRGGGRSILGEGITRFGVQGIRYFILNVLSQYTAMPSIQGAAFNIRGGDYKVWCSGYQILHSHCIITIYRNAVHSRGGVQY